MVLKTLPSRLVTVDSRCARQIPKEADAELLTAEHRAWRAEVLRLARHRCQGPNCGRTRTRLFADHIVERQDGGDPLDPANGQALCGSCHTRKTARARAERMAR